MEQINSRTQTEALEDLRRAWKATDRVERLIKQALLNPADKITVEGVSIIAEEHTLKAKLALQEAARKLTRKRYPRL